MIKIKYIHNIFSPKERQEYEVVYQGLTIKEYLEDLNIPTTNKRFILTGRVVKSDVQPLEKDELIVINEVQDVFALYVAFSALWTAFTASLPYLMVAYSIYQAVTYKAPSTPTFGSEDSTPTYGWDGVQSYQSVGVPVPVVYGTHKIGGNIINAFISTNGENNYLNVLLGICEGEIDDIDSIKINDNPIANFDGADVEKRYGANDDTIISDFQDLRNLYSQNVDLEKNDAYVYTTTNLDVEAFELHLTLPNGLYEQNSSDGSLMTWSVTYKVEYKAHTAGSYVDLGNTTISAKSRTAVRRIFRKSGLEAEQYDIRITRTSDDSSTFKMGDLKLTNVDEIKTDDLAYPNTAKLGLKLLATGQLSGGMPNITSVVRGRKISVPEVLDGDEELVDWEDYYWDADNEEYKTLDGDDSLTWDGETYVEAYSANPIWCIRDLLLNTRFGLGEFIDTSSLDENQLLEMAQYCDEKIPDGSGGYEKRFRLDIVLDGQSPVPDMLQQIASAFRGIIFFSEGKVKILIDKPAVSTQLFGMGNIIGFEQHWKSIREKPNVIDVQYLDKDKDYEMEQVAVIDEEALADGEPLRRKQIRVYTSHMSQALREGRYALKVGKYLNRSVALRCGIDAIACQVGDVISVSHDVPQWGYSGRVPQDSDGTQDIYLAEDFVIVGGKDYQVQVQYADGTWESRTITDGAGTYDQVNVGVAFTQAVTKDLVYAIGELTKVVKPFRIMSMKMENSAEVEITALEYLEDIYDDTAVTIPTTNYSGLSDDIPLVTDLALNEEAITLNDGTIVNNLNVYFNLPDDSQNVNKYLGAKVYISDDAGTSYILATYTEGNQATIPNVIKGVTYYIKVVTVTETGLEGALVDAPTASREIVGKEVAPDIVSSFQYSWGGNILQLVWSANTELDLAGYEIRLNDDDFGDDDSNLVYRGLTNKFVLEPEDRTVGTFYIRAFSTSGIYSLTSASVEPENSAPSQPTDLDVNVFFNVARISWADSVDVDVIKYEVWRSETGSWAGEEEKVAEVSGRSVMIDGEKARQGETTSATTTTLVSESLEGLPDDFFIGDKVLITSGDGNGQERVITDFDGTTGTLTVADWVTTPEAEDTFMIFDGCEIKVRGVDYYGEGVFSSAVPVYFEGLDETAIGDNVVTARKIYVACLSALSANVGYLTAGTIQGVTIQTGSTGERTVLDGQALRSYNCDDDITFEVNNGRVCAKDLTLYDTACACRYSYLSAGQWFWNDELGQTPYVKRICSGVACTGDTVVLLGWCSSPDVQVGINRLTSFKGAFNTQDQAWDVYHSTPVWFCTSAVNYGYCFDVHATLILAGSTGVTCTRNINFDVCYLTGASTCSVCTRHIFQLWCNPACGMYFAGCLCYDICYRVNGSGTWCKCSYTYLQNYSNVANLKSNCDKYDILNLPCIACWQIMSTCKGLSWVNTGICSASTTIYCLTCERTISNCASTIYYCICNSCCYPVACVTGNYLMRCLSIAGSQPANTYRTHICYCVCGYNNTLGTGGTACAFQGSGCSSAYTQTTSGFEIEYNSVGWKDIPSSGAGAIATACYGLGWVCANNNLNYHCCKLLCTTISCTYLRFCSAVNVAMRWNGVHNAKGESNVCFCCGKIFHCYCCVCTTGSAGNCCYLNVYSTQETFGTSCTLDPAGCINWLAIGYN